jgi:trehalose utilization protein
MVNATQQSVRVVTWSDDAAGVNLPAAGAALHKEGVAATLAAVVRDDLESAAEVTVAGLHEADDGLPESLLEQTDVLVWWGHEQHDEVADATVDRVQRHVLDGLGLVVLHSGHHARVFRRLMGTSCNLAWREGDDEELVWTVDPAHPIAAGVEHPIVLGRHEMYGEPFDIPAPDALVFVSSFTGGEVFRSGCCFHRGGGRIFYFSVGHETYPVFEHPQVRRVLGNAVVWAAGTRRASIASRGATEVAPRGATT